MQNASDGSDAGHAVREDGEAFRVERAGDIAIIIPSSIIEELHEELGEQIADLIDMQTLDLDPPMVVLDLSEVSFFGSMFLSLLLRVHRKFQDRGGSMVLCGVSPGARELLAVTNLAIVWAIYDSRAEAIAALEAE